MLIIVSYLGHDPAMCSMWIQLVRSLEFIARLSKLISQGIASPSLLSRMLSILCVLDPQFNVT